MSARHAAVESELDWPADAPWGRNELAWVGEATRVTRQLNETRRAERHPAGRTPARHARED